MKQNLYSYKAWGSHNIDLEILVDVGRELTENDMKVGRKVAEILVNGLLEESINLDPKSKEAADKERAEILGLFGDRAIFVDNIPNGYCSQYCCKHLPWFIVTTTKGRIKIGWRKRVISIEWEDSIIPDDAETLFPNEDVTKFNKGIHAGSLDKAKAYIDKLLDDGNNR